GLQTVPPALDPDAPPHPTGSGTRPRRRPRVHSSRGAHARSAAAHRILRPTGRIPEQGGECGARKEESWWQEEGCKEVFEEEVRVSLTRLPTSSRRLGRRRYHCLAVDLDRARAFLGGTLRGILATIKRDGRPQHSNILDSLDDDSTTTICV